MTPQELKNSILQLAIQGKLVEQRPEEGTGEELYRKIQAEKQALIKAGKIKKEKPLPEISDDEKPFDIPETWVWVRLKVITYNRGQAVPQQTFSYIDIGSIDNIHQKLSPAENIIEAKDAPSRARRIVDKGDILYSTVRPYLHNMCIIDRDFEFPPIASTGFAAITCYDGIYNKYLFYYLLSSVFDSYANANENAKGVAYPAINDDRLYRAVIALPPLAEQKRIVAKIEELLPYIDRYEQAWSRLEDFNKSFPVDMQKSILQMAIQGKLVEQRPEEGTGEALYREIQAEKQRLIKEGKIKKEKPLPEISDEEKPFDIPESWRWVRLGNIFSIIMGQSPDGDSVSEIEKGIEFHQGKIYFSKLFIEHSPQKTTDPKKLAPANSVLLCVRAPVGKVNITDREICIGRGLAAIVGYAHISPLFTYYWTSVLESDFIKKSTGTTFKAISFDTIANHLIPLPPLAEQKRIVAKLEEILPLCEKLK